MGSDIHGGVRSDFLIVGSGIAGLSLALNLAEQGSVCVVTKKDIADSNTNYAQGGIASVMGSDDSADLHVADTLAAGAGLCRREVVEMVVREGPGRIRDLLTLGVAFTAEGGRLSLGLEGGHSRKRIVHSRDHTGREVERRLLDAVKSHDSIAVYPYHAAIDLIATRHLEKDPASGHAVWGAYVLDRHADRVLPFVARRTILATGGAGKVYLYTTNPDIATGDGIAMAYRAGARIANLEFVQFHPTSLFHPRAKRFLLSEALRGEGGRLHAEGTPFMERYDERGELAPRDVVARAIDAEMKRTGASCVYLDITHLDPAFIEKRFPSILEQCLEFGIDVRRQPIPVVPATHYFCGGVDVDMLGRSSVPNLLAIGEVSHTGLHGANRLASNSLLEALVFAKRAYEGVMDGLARGEPLPVPRAWTEAGGNRQADPVVLEHDWDDARRVMWDYVGIVRSDARLEIARRRMQIIKETVEAQYWTSRVTQDLLELRNIVLVGQLVIESARSRKESRGLHYTETHPERDDTRFLHDTVLVQEVGAR